VGSIIATIKAKVGEYVDSEECRMKIAVVVSAKVAELKEAPTGETLASIGMSETAALRFSSAFGAGLGRMRGTCGAFSGLCMVAGFCKGNLTGNPEDKEIIFSLTRELAEVFKKEFGSLNCRDLLHLDTEMEKSARPSERTSDYYAARPCERCVAFCASLAQKLIDDSANS
jgi:C_GCAxxG_C_C family probable redox protein